MNFNEKLKILRHNANLTQEGLAKLVGITERSIYNYENTQRIPSVSICKKIAEVFCISVVELTNGSDVDVEQNLFTMENERQKHQDIEEILEKTSAIFSGGTLCEEDKDKFFEAMTKLYFKAKEDIRNQK